MKPPTEEDATPVALTAVTLTEIKKQKRQQKLNMPKVRTSGTFYNEDESIFMSNKSSPHRVPETGQ